MLCWYILYPIGITNVLGTMIHLLPAESRGKLTTGIMLFLATMLYLKMLYAQFPVHGRVPHIVVHVLSTVAITCLSQVGRLDRSLVQLKRRSGETQ